MRALFFTAAAILILSVALLPFYGEEHVYVYVALWVLAMPVMTICGFKYATEAR